MYDSDEHIEYLCKQIVELTLNTSRKVNHFPLEFNSKYKQRVGIVYCVWIGDKQVTSYVDSCDIQAWRALWSKMSSLITWDWIGGDNSIEYITEPWNHIRLCTLITDSIIVGIRMEERLRLFVKWVWAYVNWRQIGVVIQNINIYIRLLSLYFTWISVLSR